MPTRPAPDELAPVLVWHPRADEYRRALATRLPGVPIEAHGGPARTTLPSAAQALLAWHLPPGVLTHLPELRWIQAAGAGVEHLVSREDLRADVVLTRSVGRFGVQVAEYVVGYLLHLLLGIEGYRRNQDRAAWDPCDRPLLCDRRVGIVGLGHIGGAVAQALTALGAEVLGTCRTARPVAHAARVYSAEEWRRMLPHAQALVLSVPLTSATRHMIDAEAIAALPPGAILINVGRGALVDTDALVQALRQGHLGAAVLDVFEQEPLPPEHPLWTEPRAWITPHVAAPSEIEPIADEFAANYRRFVSGEPLLRTVDRDRGY